MSKVLVLSALPDEFAPGAHQARQKWGAWQAHAKIEELKSTKGVYFLAENAWVFDLDIAMPAYGRLLGEAAKADWPVRVFELGKDQGCHQIPPEPELIKFVRA